MRGLSDFVTGFSEGRQIRQSKLDAEQARKDRDEDRALRREEIAAMREGRSLSYMPAEQAAGGDGSGGKPYRTNDPVANLPAHQKAFLNAVAGGESGGRYNVRYTPNGGQTFVSFGEHPGIFEEGPEGPSSAAGRYQFTKSTWDDTGGGAFTPAAQDERAWSLAASRYRSNTGRDLDADLQARGMTMEMASVLSPTWTSFRGSGAGRAIATYNDSMGRYAQPAPAAARGVM